MDTSDVPARTEADANVDHEAHIAEEDNEMHDTSAHVSGDSSTLGCGQPVEHDSKDSTLDNGPVEKVLSEDAPTEVTHSAAVPSDIAPAEDVSSKPGVPNRSQKTMTRQEKLRKLIARSKLTQSSNKKAEKDGGPIADDNAWMEEQPEDDIDEATAEEIFNVARRDYEKKVADGEVTAADTIEFKRHEKNFHSRIEQAKREMNEEWAISDSLFIPDDLTETTQTIGNKRCASPPNQSTKRLKTGEEQDLHDDDGSAEGLQAVQEYIQEEERKLRKKENASANKKSASKPKRLSGPKSTKTKVKTPTTTRGKGKTKVKKPTKTQLAKRRQEGNLFNLSKLNGLLDNNVFRDAETNVGLETLPDVTRSRKELAMKELLASLPSEVRGVAQIDKKQILHATKLFGAYQCQASNGQWKLTGMKSELTHYQMLGVSFMRERENQTEEPRGGILADAMGLGKTVCMIANIVNGRRTHKGPTLIVAAPSILLQWADELLKHTQPGALGELLRFMKTSIMNTSNPEQTLNRQGVILTTYAEVAKSYPKFNPPPDLTSVEEKKEWWDNHYERTRGWLHRIKFHRVVLDEAQAIKNPATQTSIACRGLIATHRWAISGTPVQNSLAEFYPYFKFLRVLHTGNREVFKKNFCTLDDPRGFERLGILLQKFMIRRTHNDTLMGAKLLSLPKPTRRTFSCHFSEIEREIYAVVRTRFVLRINMFAKKGQLRTNYSSILTMLLRLRQLTCHPLLIQDTLRDLLEPQDFVKLRKITEKNVPIHSAEGATLRHLRDMLRSPEKLSKLDPTNNVSPTPTVDPIGTPEPHIELATPVASDETLGGLPASSNIEEGAQTQESAQHDSAERTTDALPNKAPKKLSVGKSFGLKSDYPAYLDDLQQASTFEVEEVVVLCPRCAKEPVSPHVTSCDHTYCHECLLMMSLEASENDEDHAKCLICGVQYTGSKPYSAATATEAKRQATEVEAPDVEEPEETVDAGKKKKPTARSVVEKWVDSNGNMLPSAKTLAFKAQLMNWLNEDPSSKILIYSQFNTMIRILAKICDIEGWSHLEFTGNSSIDGRQKMIEKFKSDSSIKIMIIGLRCGGTGLNLMCASRVLIVDLWWNSAVEDQAFCRTYRRGQTKETNLVRLAVQDSVDTDILAMQDRKEGEINRVLPRKQASMKLEVNDLLKLFGTVESDENGSPFILVDDGAHLARTHRTAALDDAESIVTGMVS